MPVEKSDQTAKILVGFILLVIVGGIVKFMWPPIGYNQGFEPTQPIPFKHSLHAGSKEGQMGIACLYCHVNPGNSRHATVPSVDICMNCHIAVKTDSPYIKQIREAYEKNHSIQWVKVHMLPDFVQFNHQRHILAGKTCNECHGAIETMDTVHQDKLLSMGWCVDCHRKKENNAPTNCSTCHY